jgi:glutamyl-tRNA synthetase
MGNLRTAVAAWGSAGVLPEQFVVRFEDLDTHNVTREHAAQQRDDLARFGIVSGSEPVFQSDRFDLYRDAIATLRNKGLVYECFCTRKEIAAAVAAPHGPVGLYPGTCRTLTDAEREKKRAVRPGALRLLADGTMATFEDYLAGTVTGAVDDVVLRRNDGVPAYNIAVVVDDALQGITEVVRGDDLLGITPSQVHLQQLLGVSTPIYGHVPLVVGPDGERLAKRHGAVDLESLAEIGVDADEVPETLWASLGQTSEVFDWSRVPQEPWVSPWSSDVR